MITCDSLPKSLVGTYYRNGPAKYTVGSDQVQHPFDGDGMILGVTFYGDGTAFVRYRFVRTAKFEDENRAGKLLYAGTFGNPKAFGQPQNVANTNVAFLDDKLYALWEAGAPHEIDPVTLDTVREVSNVPSMSAHPRRDGEKLRSYAYKPNPVTGTKIDLFEGVEDGRRRRSVKIPRVFGLFHDFVATENYNVFTAAPMRFLFEYGLDMLLGRKPVGQCIGLAPGKPTSFVIVPRDDAKPVKTIDVDTHFNFHYANAYEEEDGTIVLDTVKAKELQLGPASSSPDEANSPLWHTVDYSSLTKTTLWRYRINPESGDVDSYEICDRYLEFPVVDPRKSCRPHRFVWASTGCMAQGVAPVQGIVRIDTAGTEQTQVWLPDKPTQFAGEACVVPGENDEEGAGHLISVLFDADRRESDLLVFDASDISRGPVAQFPLGSSVCHGLHGTFVDGFAPLAPNNS